MKTNNLLLILVSVFILMICIGPLSANENITDTITASENNISDIVKSTEEEILTEDENVAVSVEPVTKEYSNKNIEYTFKAYDPTTKKPINGNAFQVIVGYNAGEDEFFGSYYGDIVNGVGKVTIDDVIPVGTHGVMVEVFLSNGLSETAYSTIKITPKVIKPTVKAPAIKVKQKANKYFKVTVKNGKSPVKNLKLKVKVLTGKKSKTYTIKTNKKGIAKLSTKKLKVGTHKVKVTSGNAKYKISKSSKIIVKKR